MLTLLLVPILAKMFSFQGKIFKYNKSGQSVRLSVCLSLDNPVLQSFDEKLGRHTGWFVNAGQRERG